MHRRSVWHNVIATCIASQIQDKEDKEPSNSLKQNRQNVSDSGTHKQLVGYPSSCIPVQASLLSWIWESNSNPPYCTADNWLGRPIEVLRTRSILALAVSPAIVMKDNMRTHSQHSHMVWSLCSNILQKTFSCNAMLQLTPNMVRPCKCV